MDTAVVMVAKSESSNNMKLELFDYGHGDNLSIVESETFQDLYTLNFHLQTLASKYNIKKGLIVVHDKDKNKVEIALASNSNAFFIS